MGSMRTGSAGLPWLVPKRTKPRSSPRCTWRAD